MKDIQERNFSFTVIRNLYAMVGINIFPSTMLWSNKAFTYVFGFKIVYTDKQCPVILDSAILLLHFLCVPLSVGAKSFQMSIPLLLLHDPQPIFYLLSFIL